MRIGTDEAAPSAPLVVNVGNEPGSTFSTASAIAGTLDGQSRIIGSTIDPVSLAVVMPGSNQDPGHRDVSVDSQRHVADDGADPITGITELSYNFQAEYGVDPLGNTLLNLITERQKELARSIFELYGYYLGVQFTETATDGFTIVTGDMRAIDPTVAVGPFGLAALAGESPGIGPTAILDAAETWEDAFGQNWFQEAMRQIGHLLGLGETFDLPPGTIMGSNPSFFFDTFENPSPAAEPVFPGDNDIVHGQYLHRPESVDIDMYRFVVNESGLFTAETFAERLANSSSLDTYVRLYRETTTGSRTLIAQNDDYFSEDSRIQLNLQPGVYYVAVSASGNDDYDPNIANSGFGGTSQGAYQLRLDFRPSVNRSIVDSTGVLLDGDADGIAGGVYNYWFRAASSSDTVYVDKAFTGASTGTLAAPYRNLATAIQNAGPGDVVRVVGNGGADGNIDTVGDNLAYQIGFTSFGSALPDGVTLSVPRDVALMIDAGAVFKMGRSVITVGSSSPTLDRSGATLQVLGTPSRNVYFTSRDDESIGADTSTSVTTPDQGDWGGIIFRADQDRASGRTVYEDDGIFLNYVNHADMRYGGGNVVVESVSRVITPIHLTDARPTITFNEISQSADAAISANPNSFWETNFHSPQFQTVRFTSDYDRIGPEIHGNILMGNSLNALFVRISTLAGQNTQPMTVSGRWDDIDIPHIVASQLLIKGTPGGAIETATQNIFDARLDASLVIDPGVVVKLQDGFIDVGISATLLAEGTADRPIVFTSVNDDRFGAGGTFDTNNDASQTSPNAGDWGGIVAGHVSQLSVDHAVVAFGGGLVGLQGNFAGLNAIEIHQAEARVTNSLFENNAVGVGGLAPEDRFGRGSNADATIFVRGAQPVIVGNMFVGNDGPVISVNANALNSQLVRDSGRYTGSIDVFSGYSGNQGPLVRNNVLDGNAINGMEVRGGTLTTESVWDDAEIVHVLRDTIYVPNFHTYGGLRLESAPGRSLVVKLSGEFSGLTATGVPMGIDDFIGGRLQIVGQPGAPVVMTSLADDTVGAGQDRQGNLQTDTNNGGRPERTNEFHIDLNFGPQIAGIPAFIEAVEFAARMWEQELQDPITVTLDVEFEEMGADTLAFAASEFVSADYSAVRSAMIRDAGPHEAIVNQLPTKAELVVELPQNPLNPFTLADDVSLTRANAKALGLSVGSSAVVSAYDPEEFRDGRIAINNDVFELTGLYDTIDWFDADLTNDIFDWERADGIAAYRVDFIGTLLHEIGHALGFVSAVDTVDGLLESGGTNRDIEMRPLDMFRLEPGAGRLDFTNATRILNPRVERQVFYDGGEYDSREQLPYVEGVTKGDIPFSTGDVNGDGNQASHWKDTPVRIGLMNPAASGDIDDLTEQDRIAFDLIGWDVVGGGRPGDWAGLRFELYSHDRNVATVTERESSGEFSSDTNGTPDTGQFLGGLAPDEKSGDDNLRLGFDVHGAIASPSDVDVYSFDGIAGTEVWFDIDRTRFAFDSVVEVIDANGTVVAVSDDSADGATFDGILDPQPFGGTDFYSINAKDAGFRVVLPGPTDSVNTYHVRVRSSSPDLSNLTGGVTFGAYQLGLRIGALDEIAGSTVDFADVRYASRGATVVGPPIQSPLAAEHVETGTFNDLRVEVNSYYTDDDPPVFVFSEADTPVRIQDQYLGNVLATEQGATSVFGYVTNALDVDWYSFDLSYIGLSSTASDPDVGLVLDIDYADGLAGPNLAVGIFDSFGTLIYYSNGSNVALDRPAAGSGSSLTDLSRGSVGTQDPFIGPITLPTGLFDGTYYVAVSSVAMRPRALDGAFVLREPVINGLQGRGERVRFAPFADDIYEIDPTIPSNQILSGRYQMEIRTVAIPEDGFDTQNASLSDRNRQRQQGQIIIGNSAFTNSKEFGIVVEDGLRDLPTYLYELQDAHSQQNTGDYVPQSGPAASLVELNKERLIPGITIKNNVISGGLEGGIHVSGDPNGYVMYTYDLDTIDTAFPDSCERWDGQNFTIWDNSGHGELFEWDSDGTIRDGANRIRFDCDRPNDVGFPDERPTLDFNVATEIINVIQTTRLDVTIYRGEDNSFFIEGAARLAATTATVELRGENVPEGDVLLPEEPIYLPQVPLPVGGEFDFIFPDDGFTGGAPPVTRQVAQQGSVPFVRIVNNTLFGRGGSLVEGTGVGDVGILVEDNASPTMLNNIIANFAVGVEADTTSTDEPLIRNTWISTPGIDDVDRQLSFFNATRPSVLGGSIFQGNLDDTVQIDPGDFVIELTNNQPLFVDPANGNFLLAAGSVAIDSSVDSLEERDGLATVTGAIGIAPSPILAPGIDQRGQLRVDDPSVEPPNGLGENVFKDRGALDRADFIGPAAVLLNPIDNDTLGRDRDTSATSVALFGVSLSSFEIQLSDGTFPNSQGVGADDARINGGQVTVNRDGVDLVEGVDYRFRYDPTNDTIRLIPLAGIWREGATYLITLDNSADTGIADFADNSLRPNRPSGLTQFTITLGEGLDFGDAPDPLYPTLLSSNGARHTFVEGFYLGAGVSLESDGKPSAGATADSDDDGVAFDSVLLPGVSVDFTVTASAAGLLDAWIDFNADGDWNDPGEKIFVGQSLAAGANALNLPSVPANAAIGETAARFRFSSSGVALPVGPAADGEVEDYVISIQANPWQNPADRFDVNGDGAMGTVDVVSIINELDRIALGSGNTADETGRLPIPRTDTNPGRFWDVNGDGFVTPLDVVQIINRLPVSAAAASSVGSITPVSDLAAMVAQDDPAQNTSTPLVTPDAVVVSHHQNSVRMYSIRPPVARVRTAAAVDEAFADAWSGRGGERSVARRRPAIEQHRQDVVGDELASDITKVWLGGQS
ncbi:MAG: NF038122 family metalloprotease [Pirellulaceae bacterium]